MSWTCKTTGYGSGLSGISGHDSQTTKTRTHRKTSGYSSDFSKTCSLSSGLVEAVIINLRPVKLLTVASVESVAMALC